MYAVYMKPRWVDEPPMPVHVCKTSEEAERYFLSMAGQRSPLEMRVAGIFVDYYEGPRSDKNHGIIPFKKLSSQDALNMFGD